MIEITTDNPGRPYVSQYQFSVIEADIRYQVVWRQYVKGNGELSGIGNLILEKPRYMPARYLKFRNKYLKERKEE